MSLTNRIERNAIPQTQMVEVNQQQGHFKLRFEIRSVDQKPFEICIATQKTIDQNIDFPFQTADEGFINGEYTYLTGPKATHFLIFRAPEQTTLVITTELTVVSSQWTFKTVAGFACLLFGTIGLLVYFYKLSQREKGGFNSPLPAIAPGSKSKSKSLVDQMSSLSEE